MYTRLLAGASGEWRLSGPVASRPTVSTRMILYLRALPEMYRFTEGGYLLAETFLRRATDIDPNFFGSLGGTGRLHLPPVEYAVVDGP